MRSRVSDHSRKLAEAQLASAQAALASPDYATQFQSPARSGVTQKKGGQSGDARQEGKCMSSIAKNHPDNKVRELFMDNRIAVQPSTHLAGSCQMTAAEWAAVRDNPRQRDTEKRAKRAEHLHTPHPAHCKVNMARLPDGRTFKLDGHTRSLLWSTDQVVPPAILYCDVWDCPSIEAVKELYSTFDSKHASESAADQVHGAKREQAMEFKSELLAGGRVALALRFAYECFYGQQKSKAISIYDLFKFFGRELQLLDECNPVAKRFSTGVTAAAIISLRRYGHTAIPFWTAIAANDGFKSGTEMDPVHALNERMERRRVGKGLLGARNRIEVLSLCLSAFDRYRDNKNYMVGMAGGGIKTMSRDTLVNWLVTAERTRKDS